MTSKTGLRFTTKTGALPEDHFALADFTLEEAQREKISIHAQKDMDTRVLNNRSTTVDHDHTETIGNRQSITVTGNQSLTVKQSRTVNITKNQSTSIGGEHTVTITGNQTTETGQTCKLTAGENILIHSTSKSIRISNPGGSIVLHPDGSLNITARHITLQADRIDLNPGTGGTEIPVNKADNQPQPANNEPESESALDIVGKAAAGVPDMIIPAAHAEAATLPDTTILHSDGDKLKNPGAVLNVCQIPEDTLSKKTPRIMGDNSIWDLFSDKTAPVNMTTPPHRLRTLDYNTEYDYTVQEMVNKQHGLQGDSKPFVFNNRQKQSVALKKDIEKYVNPDNFKTGASKYQFLNLAAPAGISEESMKNFLKGKGTLDGKEKVFLKAAKEYHISEVYLAAHAALETGNGTGELAKGIKVNGTTVYNMFGIGATPGKSVTTGAKYAYKQGWTTPEKAIEGGAKWISRHYIGKQQNTLYKMRWNPEHPATHQYATDIAWAVKQAPEIKKLYDNFPGANLTFDIPKFKPVQTEKQ